MNSFLVVYSSTKVAHDGSRKIHLNLKQSSDKSEFYIGKV